MTGDLCSALGIPSRILPMCDEPVSTVLKTPEGLLEFQEYFVRRRQGDEVLGVELRGIESARLTDGGSRTPSRVADAVVLCPSNPLVSIGPVCWRSRGCARRSKRRPLRRSP